jgi:hypothetical protein
MKHEHTNRYGDVYTFTKQEDGSVLWEGKFEWMRSGDGFIDPSGGPFLHKGQMLSHVLHASDEFNILIDGFERVEGGYLIHTRPHKFYPNDFTHLEDRDTIGGII